MLPSSLLGVLFWSLLARLSSASASGGVAGRNVNATQQRPNIVFIITDDQDLRLNSLDYQPLLNKYIKEQGTTFNQHFCTISICCPSRVSLLTGKAAHNTNVTDVKAPYGGYPKFVKEGWNEDWLPLWLQGAGYNTYYVGKLMNGHNTTNYDKPHASGWTENEFLLDPYTYIYYNATFQRNNNTPVGYPDQYSTDLVAEKALGFMENAVAADKPFFLGVAPVGPHSQTIVSSSGSKFYPPVPAARHKNLFPNITVPRGVSFNPEQAQGASWVKDLPYMNDSVIEYNDEFYRNRLRSLQAVDELVESVVTRLDDLGILDNTYIIYTADNGFHIGQHRLPPGKTCGYEEDIHVPFLVRGPGVAKNASTNTPSTHTDIAPTIFDLAGIELRDDFDGAPIAVRQEELKKPAKYEAINVEFWGDYIGEGVFGTADYTNNTYKIVRIVSKSYSLSYTVWCTNEHELYDITTDPYQVNNLLSTTTPTNTTLLGHPVSRVTARLDTLLMVLKTCKADACVNPWGVIFPHGEVSTLAEALDPKYDDFFEEQNRVSFSACALGYIKSVEGPMDVLPWEEVERWAEMS
ncbi:putative arylsulfatase [Saccharata proteae CBS 121410]|uniref:Arylsulfatase n=1 Tax=Saccharata proteae CBS 121410 TaxID=1314787 RepID=A0A9P4LZ52_9PEZI|nr:putative arylsulfatase [Saccharata proteae CBS 121410]